MAAERCRIRTPRTPWDRTRLSDPRGGSRRGFSCGRTDRPPAGPRLYPLSPGTIGWKGGANHLYCGQVFSPSVPLAQSAQGVTTR